MLPLSKSVAIVHGPSADWTAERARWPIMGLVELERVGTDVAAERAGGVIATLSPSPGFGMSRLGIIPRARAGSHHALNFASTVARYSARPEKPSEAVRR